MINTGTQQLETERFILRRFVEEDYYHWGIVCKEDGILIGTINLRVDDDNNSAETSYIVAPDYWNKGVMTEVLKKVISFGFETLKLNRIAAEFFEGNEASRRVMEKCGMKIEGTARHLYYKNGRYIDSTWCSILHKEYTSL